MSVLIDFHKEKMSVKIGAKIRAVKSWYLYVLDTTVFRKRFTKIRKFAISKFHCTRAWRKNRRTHAFKSLMWPLRNFSLKFFAYSFGILHLFTTMTFPIGNLNLHYENSQFKKGNLESLVSNSLIFISCLDSFQFRLLKQNLGKYNLNFLQGRT